MPAAGTGSVGDIACCSTLNCSFFPPSIAEKRTQMSHKFVQRGRTRNLITFPPV